MLISKKNKFRYINKYLLNINKIHPLDNEYNTPFINLKYICPKYDKLFKRMKYLSDTYWELDSFDRETDTEFFENEDELIKIGKEIFDNFKLKYKNIQSFLDICAAPGIYSKLLLNTFNNIQGIGISLPIEEGGVPFTIQDNRYQIIYKNIMDINNNLNNKINKIDLGIASCVSYFYDPKQAYILNLELIIKSIKLILDHLKINGHIIINLTIKNINVAFNIINILNRMFKKFKLWKSSNIWARKKTFYYFGYYFKDNYNSSIIDDLQERIKNSIDPINNQFLGSLDDYNEIYKQMKFIYKLRIKAWEKLIQNSNIN